MQLKYMKNQITESGRWPVILVFSRFVFATVLQFLVAGGLMLSGHTNPLQFAGRWFTVYGTLIDIGCLLLITKQLRKEGKRIRELVNLHGQRWYKSMLIGLGYTLVLFPVTVAGTMISSFLAYGKLEPQQIMGGIPLWGALFSTFIYPVLWTFTEQLTYQGYALPRLEKAFGSKWAAIALVSFGWMLQHAALPLELDFHYAAMRMLSFFPLTVIMPLLYLRTRRLLPFITAHWIMDTTAAVMGTLMPLL